MKFSKIAAPALLVAASVSAAKPEMHCAASIQAWFKLVKTGQDCLPSNKSNSQVCADGCVDASLGVATCTYEEYTNITNITLPREAWEPMRSMFGNYSSFCECEEVLDTVVDCFNHASGSSKPWDYSNAADLQRHFNASCAAESDHAHSEKCVAGPQMEKLHGCSKKWTAWNSTFSNSIIFLEDYRVPGDYLDPMGNALMTFGAGCGGNHTETCETGVANWNQLAGKGMCLPSNTSHAGTCAAGCAEAAAGIARCSAAEFNEHTGYNVSEAAWTGMKVMYGEFPDFCKCDLKADAAVECLSNATGMATPWDYANLTQIQNVTGADCDKCTGPTGALEPCRAKLAAWSKRYSADPRAAAYFKPVFTAVGAMELVCNARTSAAAVFAAGLVAVAAALV